MSSALAKNLVWIVLVAIALVGTIVAWEFTADDSYITFRYSKNVAEGNGLIWNSDSTNPVEGYTNFLWMVLMIIPHIFGWSAALFAKLLGLIVMTACITILYLYGRNRIGGHWWGIAAATPLILLPATYFHALGGLETTLFALQMLVLFIIGRESLRAGADLPGTYLWLTPIVVLLAGLTRPEGLICGTIVLFLLLKTINKTRWPQFFKSVGGFLILPGLVYFVWRYLYFGWLLPNTFYAKFGGGYQGFIWLINSVGIIGGILVLFLLAIRSQDTSGRPSESTWFTIAFLAAIILPYSTSNLWMNYMDRFLYHLMPVILVILAISLKVVFKAIAPRSSGNGIRLNGYGVLIYCLCLFPLFYANKQEVAHMSLYTSHLEYAHIELANTLRESATPNEFRTITIGDVGALPYYSDWHTYDFVGLTNETVAHNWPEKSLYIADQQPTVMVLYSSDGVNTTSNSFGFNPQVMLPHYELIAYVKLFPYYYLGVFLRKEIPEPIFADLSKRILNVSATAAVKNASGNNRAAMLARLKERLTTTFMSQP